MSDGTKAPAAACFSVWLLGQEAKHSQTHGYDEKHLSATHHVPPTFQLFLIWGTWKFSGYNPRCR